MSRPHMQGLAGCRRLRGKDMRREYFRVGAARCNEARYCSDCHAHAPYAWLAFPVTLGIAGDAAQFLHVFIHCSGLEALRIVRIADNA